MPGETDRDQLLDEPGLDDQNLDGEGVWDDAATDGHPPDDERFDGDPPDDDPPDSERFDEGPPDDVDWSELDGARVRELLTAAVHELSGTERPGQVAMASAVAEAIVAARHLLVQAGTGTGKSLAYLVPALLYAKATRKPVIVATATLALQAQLVDRDLPHLADAVEPLVEQRPRWATLKGRSNYACLHRVRDGVPDDDGALVTVAALAESMGPLGREVLRARKWAESESGRAGGTGDRDRLQPGVSDRAWAQVSVSSRECLGVNKCPYGTECFAERARRLAEGVDIVVTNHAMLAIDAIEGVPVLPPHHLVIVDEAHELAARVTSMATGDLLPGVIERAGKRSRAHVDDDLADRLIDAGDTLAAVLETTQPGRLDILPEALAMAVIQVRDAARAVQSGFAGSSDARDPENEAVRRQAKALVDDVFSIAGRIAADNTHDVVWCEQRERLGGLLRVAPLSVAGLLRERLFSENTLVLTSATLSLGGNFDAIAGSVGLINGPSEPAARESAAAVEEATIPAAWQSLDVGSPFDYPKQSILYVARRLPPPGRDGLSRALIDELVDLLLAAGGRTLGLFSSRRAAEQAAEAVRERLPDLPILCQGDDQVPTLVRRFAEDSQTCLFGTLSLWQGVDVPGSACQLVVIDRLPFPRPDDPLMSARQRAVETAGGNGFMRVAASHAALLLAQGAGRLIRSASDRGVVAVLDPRLVTARYGNYLRASLPPMWFTTDRDVVLGALRRLSATK